MNRRAIAVKCLVALLAFMAAVPRTRAQYRDWLEQQEDTTSWYAVPRVKYLRTDVEAEQENLRSSGAPNQDVTRTYISPRIGIGWDNYLYHPNLLTYSLLFEPGYVWQERTSGGKPVTSDELILNGVFRTKILQVKPYAATLSYSRSREEANYGFFSTATVDSQTWEATSGYRDGPVPVVASFQQSHDDATDFNQETITDQKLLNFRARNDREKDNATELDYQFSQFDRRTKGGGYDFSSDNTYNYASLMDVEHFERSQLQSSARLSAVDSTTSSSEDVNATLNYTVEHGGGLNSYYDYSFSRFVGNSSDSLQNYAVAGIQHQLYESLSSSVEIHGTQLSSGTSGSTFDFQSAGTTTSADYSKSLGGWAHLYLNNSTSYNFTDQQTSGSQLLINNESHVVPTNALVRLSQPRQTAIISVTDATFNPLQPSDYSVIKNTDPWRIQINILGPSKIQPGATILVTYTVRTNPSGSYSTFANQSQIRLTFWGDLVGVYTRYSFANTHASSKALLLQNDDMIEAGADFNWRGINLNANYQDEHSTFFHNRSYNLSESYSINVLSHSTLGIDLTQQWNVTSSSGVDGAPATPEENSGFYDFMLHYELRPVSSISWSSELGYQRQAGFGLDQNLFAARTYFNWVIGKLEFHCGYQHENQDLTHESRSRDFVFLQARRIF